MKAAKISTRDRRDMISDYCCRLWSGQQGSVYLAHPVRPHMDGDSYKFGGLAQYFFPWPSDRKFLIECAFEVGRETDIYIAPWLRSRPSALRGDGVPGRVLYVDIDGEIPAESTPLYETLCHAGAWRVLSGSPGRQHLYVPLDESVGDLNRLEQLNRQLASRLHGDSKWTDGSLLRMPGTWNWKRFYADGSEPAPVILEDPR